MKHMIKSLVNAMAVAGQSIFCSDANTAKDVERYFE